MAVAKWLLSVLPSARNRKWQPETIFSHGVRDGWSQAKSPFVNDLLSNAFVVPFQIERASLGTSKRAGVGYSGIFNL